MSVMNGFREELTSKILGVNGHLKIQPLNGLEIKNVVALESRIEKKINTIKTHKVLIGQSLLNYSTYSTGGIMKG